MWLDLFSQLGYCLQKVLLSKDDDDDREKLSDKAKNINTKRSTNTWINAYKYWARERQENEALEEYNAAEFDSILAKFYGDLRNVAISILQNVHTINQE